MKVLDVVPVYFSYSNQENNSDIINGFVKTITENGAVVLDDSFVDCEKGVLDLTGK